MSIELKIKAATLAAEAIITKQYERRFIEQARELEFELHDVNDPTWEPERQAKWRRRAAEARVKFRLIQDHRKGMRTEARATHLARMFLAGTPYLAAEQFCYTLPAWDQVERMVLRYASQHEHKVSRATADVPFISVQLLKQRLAEWKAAPCPTLEAVVEKHYLKEAAAMAAS